MRLITFPTEPPTVAPTPNRTLRYVDISNSGGLQLANVRLARRNMTTFGRQADRPFTTPFGYPSLGGECLPFGVSTLDSMHRG
jgi:hypothetical protein